MNNLHPHSLRSMRVPADMKTSEGHLPQCRQDAGRHLAALGRFGNRREKCQRSPQRNHRSESFEKIDIDGTVRAESTKDIVNDIFAYRKQPKLR